MIGPAAATAATTGAADLAAATAATRMLQTAQVVANLTKTAGDGAKQITAG